MFRSSAGIQRRATVHQTNLIVREYRREADSWFDGSVASVDRRIAHCRRAQHVTEAAIAGSDLSQCGKHLRTAGELQSDIDALQGLRHDLLTGCANRSAPEKTAARRGPADLGPQDRRWVRLETTRFVRANRDAVTDLEEMSERAVRHARVATWQLPGPRAKRVTAAFVERVCDAAARQRAAADRRTAAHPAPTTIQDFNSAFLFL